MSSEKERSLEWRAEPGGISLGNLDSWYLGTERIHTVPSKADYADRGISTLLDGWLPASTLIHAGTRVIGVGSCFAQYFITWLADHGFNRAADTSAYNALVRYGSTFESPAVIAQQFRWAFDEFDAKNALWIGKDRELFEANEERRKLVRETLGRTDVLILTLGLSEVWYDNVTGEPMWRALTKRHYDPARHVFRVETMQDTKRHLEKIEELRQRHLPALKIVYTVSPVRLAATFRPVAAVTANSASKAILRAALDEFLRERPALVNRELFYFPSYEIVHDFFRDAFDVDNRHVTPHVAKQVVNAFARFYCAPEMLADIQPDAGGDEQVTRLADLERRIVELQRVCDERQKVIEGLDQAARERLALVEKLHAECAALQRQIAEKGTRKP